jgi:DNA adenine methylase
MAMTTKTDPWAHIPQPPGNAEAAAAVAAQRHGPTTKAKPRRKTASRSSASRSRRTETRCAQQQTLLFDNDIADSQSGGAGQQEARPSPERSQGDDETVTATQQLDLFGGVAFHGLPPVLKWAGGKRELVPTLRAMSARHAHRRLVEPFCGGAAVALGLRPGRAHLNDSNLPLVNFYRHVQRGLVITSPIRTDDPSADLTAAPWVRYPHFYGRRDELNALIHTGDVDSEYAAWLFYVLSRTSFNGLPRFNNAGDYNVPIGGTGSQKKGVFKPHRLDTVPDFAPYRAVFEHWTFTSVDFESVPLDPADFVYADPPYDETFTQYSAGGFDWNDQVRAATWLAAHPGPVIASNAATDRIVDLYRDLGFAIDYVAAPRRISADGDRTPVREMLATKHL